MTECLYRSNFNQAKQKSRKQWNPTIMHKQWKISPDMDFLNTMDTEALSGINSDPFRRPWDPTRQCWLMIPILPAYQCISETTKLQEMSLNVVAIRGGLRSCPDWWAHALREHTGWANTRTLTTIDWPLLQLGVVGSCQCKTFCKGLNSCWNWPPGKKIVLPYLVAFWLD